MVAEKKKKRKDCAFQRQCNEKPRFVICVIVVIIIIMMFIIILGCPGMVATSPATS